MISEAIMMIDLSNNNCLFTEIIIYLFGCFVGAMSAYKIIKSEYRITKR